MVFSKKASSVISFGFFAIFTGVLLPNMILFLSGATVIVYISINWLFYSSTEKALFTTGISVSREINIDSKDHGTFTNKKITVTVSVKNNTYRRFGYAEITDIVPESFEVTGGNSRVITLDEKSEYKFSYFVIPRKRGEHQFPGLNIYASDPRGFFYSEKFFRIPVKITVYPSIEEISIDKLRQKRSALRILGMHGSRQLGIGTDFAGIREYIPGDPFKKIEWKSSARINKLMTREFESEVAIPSLVFLDITPSMDSGKAGYTKLDYAIKTAVAFSKFALDNRDPVGLYTFSDRLIDRLPPVSGKKQLYMILRKLAKINPGMSVLNTDNYKDNYNNDYIIYDSEYMIIFGIVKEFLCKSYPDTFDEHESSVDLKIKEYVGKLAGLNKEKISELTWNTSVAKRYLIGFCIKNGLQLPLKVVNIKKENGLAEAIKTALTEIKGTAFIVILSDLDGMDAGKIKNALKLARLHHHSIMILAPFTPWFESKPEKKKSNIQSKIPFFNKKGKDHDAITEEIFSLKYSKSRKKLIKELNDFGITAQSLGPEDSVIKMLAQLVKMKQQKMLKV